MKITAKSTALILALSIALAAFTGCGKSKIDTADDDIGENGIVSDSTVSEKPDDDDGKGDIIDENEDVSVAEDLEKFLNEDMVEINANYEKLTDAIGEWDTENSDSIKASITDVLIPLINDSFEKLGEFTPKTEDVLELKNKYETILAGYKDGFAKFIEAYDTDSEETALDAMEKITNAIELVDEYNAGLEKLASENGLTIEY